jgi:hypothetical protein
MPRQHRYLLQTLARKGASWQTVEKLREEHAAIVAGDILARSTEAWELKVQCGAVTVERWVLRDKPERVR